MLRNNGMFGLTPFRGITDAFKDDFSDFFEPAMYRVGAKSMRLSIKDKDDCVEYAIELPGFKKEDIKAELKDGFLTVSATHNDEKTKKDAEGKVLYTERSTGSCSRTFEVGESVEMADITAGFEDGELTIRVAKKEQKPEPKSNTIDIK